MSDDEGDYQDDQDNYPEDEDVDVDAESEQPEEEKKDDEDVKDLNFRLTFRKTTKLKKILIF